MSIRFIPTSVHGLIDHGVGPTLLAAPAIFDLRDDSPEGLVVRVAGGLQTIYANLTDYEMSMKNLVPMPVHLALDGLSGTALALVPQLTGARKRGLKHWAPQLGFGLLEVGLALFTKTEPPARTTAGRAAHVAKQGLKLKLVKDAAKTLAKAA